MLNLVLDTNAWIYLANGYNPETQKNEEDGHFQLAEWIVRRVKDGQCRIFSNYVIRKEWERNKEKCNCLIIKYERQIEQQENALRNKRRLHDYAEHAQVSKELKADLIQKIARNKQHIKTINEIFQESIDIPISNEQRVKVVEWAIEKKPPFHHKDNSVGDALIFLSTVDYFFNDFDEFYIQNTVFVSNNTSDFSGTVGGEQLHPQLEKMLDDKPIIFERNLAKAIDAGDKIIERYEDYLKYLNRDVITCLMDCKGTEYFMAEVLFDERQVINEDKDGFVFISNQKRLTFGPQFDLSEKDLKELDHAKFQNIDIGCCSFCSARHVRCCCGAEHASYGDNIECGCGREFKISNGRVELISSKDC